MARRKAQTIDVPSSLDEALAKAASYVQDDRGALKVRLHYEAKIDRLKAERDLMLVAVDAVQKQRFAALKAWWEAGGRDLAGKKRSAELAGATLGVRLTTPAVKFAKGWNAGKALAWLSTIRWRRRGEFIRTKTEIDKQAIIKAISERDVAKLFANVLTVDQTDEFFIDTGLDEAALRRELSGEPG